MSVEPGRIVGNYLIQSELGEGGMARVYRARHVVLGSAHAIKVLDRSLVRNQEIRLRFLEEGKIQAQLRHPHITPVTDLIAEPGVAALVMPLLAGEDLEVMLKRDGAFPPDTAVLWVKQVLNALSFVHARGVVHRDLKPSNLFLECIPGGGQTIRVMDFGIARVMEVSRTRTGANMGTPHYMSPEQILSPKNVDQRTDIFSVGAVLYELLTGRVAFDGDTVFDIQRRIVEGQYTDLRSIAGGMVPGSLASVVDRALATKPAARFPSAASFSAALENRGRAAGSASQSEAGVLSTVMDQPSPTNGVGMAPPQTFRHRNRITPKYRRRRDELKARFPAAHDFLIGLEQGDSELWLSTATNAHLYSGDRFLAYIRPKGLTSSAPALVLSPRFNGQIHSLTQSRSELLFSGPLDAIITGLGGFSAGWVRQGASGERLLSMKTPVTFFTQLQRLLVSL